MPDHRGIAGHPAVGVSLVSSAVGLAFLLAGCFGYKEVSLVEVRAVEVNDFTAEGLAVVAEAVIDNPNGYRISARDPDVDLFLEGAPIGKAVLDSTITLDKRSKRTYRIPMHAHFDGGIPFVTLMMAASRGAVAMRAQGTIVGRVGLFRRRFPFAWEQTVEFAPPGQ